MQNSSPLRSNTEMPSALVCIAYRQVSMMTGTKDPTEKPKAKEIKEEIIQHDTLIKRSFADFKANHYVETCLEFSKDMMVSIRLLLQSLKTRFEEFQNRQSILDLFSLSNLLKWTKAEQITETINEKLPKH